jgi:UDP-N-acetylglucosamine--N-acetylmuramyl-(pentapeptide) pyrophosphoryl-undecaprenol N-acetylglucosamine transferase
VRRRPYAVITGGGTGGHVSPALAVGEALVAAGHSLDEIAFVGGRRGIEAKLVPEAGFPLVRLPGRGLQRRFTLENLPAAVGLLSAALLALVMALRDRPRVVVTVGGYAGFAYALAAVCCRIPLVVVNVDAVPGAANRLVGRLARANAVAFPGTDLPRAVVTGPPVRAGVLAVARDAASSKRTREALGFDPARRFVVATGGSLGAASVNEAVLDLAVSWAGREDVALYHVAGDRNLEAMRLAAAERGLFDEGLALQYRLAGFDVRLVAALAACDLAVCRAGASTVAELTAIGVPSVLVPLPGAPGDHQTRNATALAAHGAALVIADRDLEAKALAAVLDDCLSDGGKLAGMSLAAASLGRRDAAEQVAAIAIRLADSRAPRRAR